MPRILAIVCLLLLVSCSKPPPNFEDVPPAEDLYAEGRQEIENREARWWWPYGDHSDAIEILVQDDCARCREKRTPDRVSRSRKGLVWRS